MCDNDRKVIVSNLEDYLASLECAVKAIKTGSDMEKGYLLEKLNAMTRYAKMFL